MHNDSTTAMDYLLAEVIDLAGSLGGPPKADLDAPQAHSALASRELDVPVGTPSIRGSVELELRLDALERRLDEAVAAHALTWAHVERLWQEAGIVGEGKE